VLELRRLQMLCELRSRGTIGAVARALSLTPSAVSQQLAQLQRDVGVALIQQAGRRVHLTPAGEQLADHAESLLDHMERAEREFAAYANAVRGKLRVVGFPTAIVHLLAPCLPSLGTRYPELRIEVEDDETEQVLQRVILGEADVALADEYEHLPRPRDRRLTYELLLAEAVRLALPSDHALAKDNGPVVLQALQSEAWACGTAGTSHAAMVTQVCNELGGFHPDIRYRSDDLAVLLSLVSTGSAVALLPDLVGAHHDPDVAVRDLADGQLARLVFAWIRKADAVPPAIRALIDTLQQYASCGACNFHA
jgi:DNA-binding transcriptional LysR family regulator